MKRYNEINLYILVSNKEANKYLGKGGKITNDPKKGNYWMSRPNKKWFDDMANPGKGKWEDWYIQQVKYVFKGIYILNEELCG